MINMPASYSATNPPKQTLQAVYDAGKYKAALTLDVLVLQSFMAGVYIAMAGQLFLSLGGGVLGSAFFPTGLIAVTLTSGELFTGDALIFVAGLLGGHVSAKSMLRNWVVSWCCNFIGCLAWAFVLGYCSDALADLGKVDFSIAVALKKNRQSWLGTFLKGIGANFMVCLGVWQATCAQEVAGKILALWFPVAGFVIMGFDHCIADQFLVPMGMMLGADVSIFDLFFGILAPATLGNIVGGGIFVGAVYWYVFDSMESFNAIRVRIRQGWNAWPSKHSSHANLPASGDDGPCAASESGLEIP
jgi:formate/nitrite transporter